MELRVKINAYEVGIVMKDGNIIDILTEGKYFKKLGTEVYIYNTTQLFTSRIEWSILEKNEKLMKMLEIVDTTESELAIVYKDNRFYTVVNNSRLAYWKGVLNMKYKKYDIEELSVPKEINKAILKYPLMTQYYRLLEVSSQEQAILYVNGEKRSIIKGGQYYFWNNTKKLRLEKVDMRNQDMEIIGQEILTKDKAAIRINFQANYKIIDVEKALMENKDFSKQLYSSLQMAIRSYIGTLTLDELMENKEQISGFIIEKIKSKITKLGVAVNSAGIKDIILPGEIKEIMNKVLVAQKSAQANTITRREETASTRSLLNTAKLMDDNEMLFRLKEMEYVEKIAEKIGEISLNGNGGMVKQLKEIFGAKS
ncbi:MAG: slipin family protein [Flavobacteriales bacterium]|jgi:regulator of protease activity HflC (stomatin/prohibitin superfamily)|nr:slipin family protein [Flavobacteriales bacterium]